MKFAGSILLVVTLMALATGTASAVDLPPNFGVFTVGNTASFSKPVALAFAGDGRIFVAEQRGRIYILEPDANPVNPRTDYTKLTTPFMEIEDEVLFHVDRGLLGLTLDPDFASNRWVYFAYMVETNSITGGPPDFVQDSYTRVERVQASLLDPNVADLSTRQILIGSTWDTGIPSTHTSHTTGTLVFGDDGSLLISHGDGSHFDVVDPGGLDPDSFLPGRVSPDQDVGSFRSPYLDSMSGKVLRVDPATGDGLPSNPWYDVLNPDSPRSRVWAKGLRNPYRMDLRRGSGSTDPADGNPGLLAIAEVGWQEWEEINFSRGGEDFGWPCYEGEEAHVTYQSQTPLHSGCTGDDSYVTYGATTYRHGGGISMPFPGLSGYAAVGATFQQGSSWPAYYSGLMYFTDYVGRWIYGLRLDENENPTELVPFATNTATPVELRFDPYSQDLFSIDFNSGQILRYAYTGVTGIGEDPSQPTGLAGIPGNSEAQLSWILNPETDVAGYHVFRSPSDTGPWTQITTALVAGSQYTDIGLANEVSYWYHIVAVDTEDPARSSVPSDPVEVIPTAKYWEWYTPHPGPVLELLAAPAPFPRRISIPDPNTAPDYDLWTSANRAPQLRSAVGPGEDFTLETTIDLNIFVPGEDFHTGIVVRFTDLDALMFGPHRGTSLQLERTGTTSIASWANSATTMDLRVVRTGSNFSFEFREDASQPWNVVDVYSTADQPTHVGILGKTWSSDVGLVIDVLRLGLNELPPVAEAQADQLIGPAPHTVQFSSTSFDPDGSYLGYDWDFGDGNTATTSAPSHEFLLPGPYEVVLTVTDGAGFTALDTLSIFAEGNQPPTAQILAPLDGYELIDPALSINLSGTGTDPDDLVGSLVFSWSIDLHSGGVDSPGIILPPDGMASSFVPTVTDTGQGVTWDVILTVTDPLGLSATDTVTVIDASLPPFAMLDLRAALADSLIPPLVPGAASPWKNLGSAGAAAHANLQNFGSSGWAGTGVAGDPWRLDFDGFDDVVTIDAGVLTGLDQAASVEMWTKMPADIETRSYLVEWLADTAPPFAGMSLAVENGNLRIYLGSWIDLVALEPSVWIRIVAIKDPGHWLVEVDGVVVGEGSVSNLGAQTTELVVGAGTFAGAQQYSEHAGFSVAELRVWNRALSPANRTVLSALDQDVWAKAPRLDLVSPVAVANTAVSVLTLDGLYFVDGAQVELIRAGIDTLNAAPVAFVDQSRLTASFDFSGLTGGPRDLRVINPDGQSMTLQAALTVQEPSPATLEFLASARDGISPPAVPSNESPWLSTLGPDTLTLVNFDATASSGWQGDGSIDDPWQLRLDGDNDELLLNDPALDDVLISQALSTEFWVRVDESDSVGVFLRWEQPLRDFELNLRRTGVNLLDGGLFYPLGQLPRDRWVHLAFAIDTDSVRLWIDAVPSGVAPGFEIDAGPPSVVLGRDLDADLAIFRLADTAMTQAQVSTCYSANASNFPSPLAARLTLQSSLATIALDDSVVVDLRYDDLGHEFGLRGSSVSILYDANLLSLVSVDEGEFLPGTGTSFFASNSSVPGIIDLDMSLLGQGSGAIGAGVLAHMRFFHIAGTDTATTLSIVPAQLIDAQDPPQPIPVLELKTLPLGIDTEVIVTAPPAVTRNLLHPAAPNPFNPRTEIAFDLAADGRAQLAVYDLAGRLVRVLVDRPLRAGPHAFIWDGIDHAGRRVASGVYLYALRPETGDQIVRKMTLLK